ncbi:MAG: RAMP superfamily CRISPR-associated protein [Thermacetogeniaceae bacterium]
MPKGTGTLLRQKPYTFIPILPVRREDRCSIVPHDILDKSRFTGKMTLELSVVTPLHIGSGSYRMSNGKLVQAFMRNGDIPVIPGSSLKGAVRSLAEAASRSCLSQPPVSNNSRLEDALQPGVGIRCYKDAACITCRLFGFVGKESYRGRVVFGEFRPVGDVKLTVTEFPALEQPFKDYKGRGNERLYYCRFYEAVPCKGPEHCPDCTKEEWLKWWESLKGKLPPASYRGRKLYLLGEPRRGTQPLETAPSGSTFRGDVTFQNLNRDELSLLCFALGLDGVINLRIGYGKPAYYGTVQTRLLGVSWYARGDLFKKTEYPDLQELVRNYGDRDPDVKRNVNLIREILSGERCGPAWGKEGY